MGEKARAGTCPSGPIPTYMEAVSRAGLGIVTRSSLDTAAQNGAEGAQVEAADQAPHSTSSQLSCFLRSQIQIRADHELGQTGLFLAERGCWGELH